MNLVIDIILIVARTDNPLFDKRYGLRRVDHNVSGKPMQDAVLMASMADYREGREDVLSWFSNLPLKDPERAQLLLKLEDQIVFEEYRLNVGANVDAEGVQHGG